ncbi:MAG: hypothetical protein ACHQQS_06195 [Thermoanaerobaculales bacterium]
MSDPSGPFAAMLPPSPPRELRERVLHAARVPALVQSRERTVVIRWGLSRFDLAWIGALVLLVVCNLLLPTRGGRGPKIASSRLPSTEERSLASELGLSGMQLAPLTRSSARPAKSLGRDLEQQIVEVM